MKSYYYSTLVFALLLGSCSQQKQLAKTPGGQPNTVGAQLAPADVQMATTPKQNYGENWKTDPRDYYEDAYGHLQQMLNGEQPIDFKKAVFITENAWCEDKISYETYNNYITALASECKAWKKANPLRNYFWEKDSTQVALNGAVYHVMTDTIRDKKGNVISTPYHYDFNDCFAKDNWTNMFVTKLMATHGGNCHSLPFLYKILTEDLGSEAYLCFLPGHIYINQYSQKTSWYNTELTGRCFPVDAWLMTTGYVSVQSIRTGLYMDTLSLEQSVAACVNDLAKGYERKFGDENYKFVLKCCDLGLAYYPNYGELLLLKAETLKKLYQSKIAEYGLNAPESKEYGDTLHSIYRKMEQTYNTLAKLDYREIPDGLYNRWTDAMINGGKAENENIHDTIVYTDIGGKKEGVITVCYGNTPMLFSSEDTIRRIGSVIFNSKRHKVEYFILKDDYAYGNDLNRPTDPARFLSVDPIAKQFPELSPYQYAGDNPIKFIDLDGLEPAFYAPHGVRKLASDQLQGAVPDDADYLQRPVKSEGGDPSDVFLNSVQNTVDNTVSTFKIAFTGYDDDGNKVSDYDRQEEIFSVMTFFVTDGDGEGFGDGIESDAVSGSTKKEGIVYEKTHPETKEKYIGQSINEKNYLKRQKVHDRKAAIKHEYKIVEKAAPGKDLDVAEETHIRKGGGPSKKGGNLANKRYQMSDKRYKAAGGKTNKPTQ